MATATDLLKRWNEGSHEARNELMELLYAELRAAAGRVLAGRLGNQQMQPTELVSEAILKLFPVENPSWESRAQFLAYAANGMRQILVDHFRREQAGKRRHERVTLGSQMLGLQPNLDLEAVDHALEQLALADESLARLVEMKFFAGMNNREIAHATQRSESTIKRQWRTARAYLLTQVDWQQ